MSLKLIPEPVTNLIFVQVFTITKLRVADKVNDYGFTLTNKRGPLKGGIYSR